MKLSTYNCSLNVRFTLLWNAFLIHLLIYLTIHFQFVLYFKFYIEIS